MRETRTWGFRDFIVWRKSLELTRSTHEELANCRDYPYERQDQRAIVSIMNNIPEGSGRKSDKAFSNFLCATRGSASEVGPMILLGGELGYFDTRSQRKLLAQISEISRLLSVFMKKLKAQDS